MSFLLAQIQIWSRCAGCKAHKGITMLENQEKRVPTGVFCYGTLMRGKSNHRLVAHARQIVDGRLSGARLYDLPYGYPAILLGDDGIVHGELYIFDNLESALSSVDRLEGYKPDNPYASLFIRKNVNIQLADGRYCSAYTYVAGPSLVQRIPSIGQLCKNGIWK